MTMGYDIIGDIHGCGKTLNQLLIKLGYHKIKGVYQHRLRQAIFVGDIIDRGPNIRLACQIVRDMVDAGSALMVLGNHEYNLITYCTPTSQHSLQPFLREHTPRNSFVVEQTLTQYAHHKHELNDLIQWLKIQPLFLDLPSCRIIHACWHTASIQTFLTRYHSNRLPSNQWANSVDPSSWLYAFLDQSLRGTALKLPNNRSIVSTDGMERHFFRTHFWKKHPNSYRDVVFQPDPLPVDLIDKKLNLNEKEQLLYYSSTEKPLFIGHYWQSGVPELITNNIACVDYSAVKYGRLVAYRMDNETTLNAKKFTWIQVKSS